MLWGGLSLQTAMRLLSSELTFPWFPLTLSRESFLYISRPAVSSSAPAKKDVMLFGQITLTNALTVPGLCSQALQVSVRPCTETWAINNSEAQVYQGLRNGV